MPLHPQFGKRAAFQLANAVMAVLLLSASGCAIHYFNEKTGVEHLIGFGHMRMKVAPPHDGVQAVVTGVDTAGAALDAGKKDFGLTLGLERKSQIDIVAEDAAVALEWPTSSLFDVRVGSRPPFLLEKPPVPGGGNPQDTTAPGARQKPEGNP